MNYIALLYWSCLKTDRHWDEMSVVAGKNIAPDASASMRKMLKLDLMSLLDKFETVSAGAAKVCFFPKKTSNWPLKTEKDILRF